MYVVVIGGGKVGYYLTKALLEERHEVLLVERDFKRAKGLVPFAISWPIPAQRVRCRRILSSGPKIQACHLLLGRLLH